MVPRTGGHRNARGPQVRSAPLEDDLGVPLHSGGGGGARQAGLVQGGRPRADLEPPRRPRG